MDVLDGRSAVPAALLKHSASYSRWIAGIEAHGQVAWAKTNGQTGVPSWIWMKRESSAASVVNRCGGGAPGRGRMKSSRTASSPILSLGGCYVETDSPFPEHSLVRPLPEDRRDGGAHGRHGCEWRIRVTVWAWNFRRARRNSGRRWEI